MKIGILQQHNTADLADNKTRLAQGIIDLAHRGAELIVLQELHNSLYFCQIETVDNFDLAEPVPGPSTDFYGKLARDLNVVIVTSLFERRAPGLYHTAKNFDEQREIFSKAVLSDYFLMSSNAITLDGELINIDGTGNRVACLSYGPKHVIMIVGMNKVVNDVEDGIKRVRNFASPPNTLRLGLKTPCSMTGRCGDCYGDTCICSQIVVTRRQSAMMKDRVKVILVGESLGY